MKSPVQSNLSLQIYESERSGAADKQCRDTESEKRKPAAEANPRPRTLRCSPVPSLSVEESCVPPRNSLQNELPPDLRRNKGTVNVEQNTSVGKKR